jgi:hypothetical protein
LNLKKKKPKPNRNRVKPTSFGSVRFGSVFLVQKPVPTGLARFFLVWARFFPVWLGFSGLARFFSVFSSFGSVRFFQFFAYKTEPNRTCQFF